MLFFATPHCGYPPADLNSMYARARPRQEPRCVRRALPHVLTPSPLAASRGVRTAPCTERLHAAVDQRAGAVVVAHRDRELQLALESGQITSLKVIGDAEAPNIIAQAIYAGHCAAREFDEDVSPDKTP